MRVLVSVVVHVCTLYPCATSYPAARSHARTQYPRVSAPVALLSVPAAASSISQCLRCSHRSLSLSTTTSHYNRALASLPEVAVCGARPQAFCISFFTLEAVARILTCPDLKKYFNDTLNLIDLVAILPFYMTLALQNTEIPGLEVLRVVRLVRVLRLFKVSLGFASSAAPLPCPCPHLPST